MIKDISILGTSVLLEKTPVKNLSYTGMHGRNFMFYFKLTPDKQLFTFSRNYVNIQNSHPHFSPKICYSWQKRRKQNIYSQNSKG
jgi:hypothetical protein